MFYFLLVIKHESHDHGHGGHGGYAQPQVVKVIQEESFGGSSSGWDSGASAGWDSGAGYSQGGAGWNGWD